MPRFRVTLTKQATDTLSATFVIDVPNIDVAVTVARRMDTDTIEFGFDQCGDSTAPSIYSISPVLSENDTEKAIVPLIGGKPLTPHDLQPERLAGVLAVEVRCDRCGESFAVTSDVASAVHEHVIDRHEDLITRNADGEIVSDRCGELPITIIQRDTDASAIRQIAIDRFADDDIQIVDDAAVEVVNDGSGAWVAARIWIPFEG